MPKDLYDLDIEELSLVDKGANRKKFFIVKRDVEKAIGEGAGVGRERQGVGGVRYCICPKCGYSVEHEREGEGKSKPCTEVKCPKCGTPLQGSNSKKLEEVNKDMEKFKKLLDEFVGEEVNPEDIEKAQIEGKALTALKSALTILNKYKTDFPDEVVKAIGVLASNAGYPHPGKYPYPTKKEEEDYKGFMSACMKEGKSMKECALEWGKKGKGKEEEAEKKVKKIDELTGEVKKLSEENTELKDKIEKAGQRIKDEETKTKEGVEKIEKEKTEIKKELEVKKVELERKVIDIEKANTELSEKVAGFEKSLTELKTYIDEHTPLRKGLGPDKGKEREETDSKIEVIRKKDEYKKASPQEKLDMIF